MVPAIVMWLLIMFQTDSVLGSSFCLVKKTITTAEPPMIRLLPSRRIVLIIGAFEITPPGRYVWNVGPSMHLP